MKKVDAHVIQPHEYEEAPEWTDEQIASAIIERGPGLSHREDDKIAVHLQLAADIVDRYKASGPKWQERMQDDLAEAAKRLKAS